MSNWVIRSAERISADVLASCGDWPELRRYLLVKELIATRSLERLRNQLNAQQRWSEWFEKPIQLYESQRRLYRLEQGERSPRCCSPNPATRNCASWVGCSRASPWRWRPVMPWHRSCARCCSASGI